MNKKQLESLYDICSYTRAAGSTGEQRMIRKHIEPVIDYSDGYGNYYKRIGSAPTIWASHTDSVHKKNDPVEQTVYIDENESRLFKGEDKMWIDKIPDEQPKPESHLEQVPGLVEEFLRV